MCSAVTGPIARERERERERESEWVSECMSEGIHTHASLFY